MKIIIKSIKNIEKIEYLIDFCSIYIYNNIKYNIKFVSLMNTIELIIFW